MVEKELRRNIITYAIIFCLLCITFIGTTYSYYNFTVDDNEENSVLIKSASMLLRFEEGNSLNVNNIIPGMEDEYVFSIENYSDDTVGKYKIVLEVEESLTDKLEENFVYELVGESSTKSDKSYLDIDETMIPISDSELGVASIPVNTIHTYKLKIKLKDNNKNQNYLAGKNFISRIKVECVYN